MSFNCGLLNFSGVYVCESEMVTEGSIDLPQRWEIRGVEWVSFDGRELRVTRSDNDEAQPLPHPRG